MGHSDSDTTTGHYRRFRVSRLVAYTSVALCVVFLTGFIWFGRGLYRYHFLAGERLQYQKKLDERNAQLRFFAERMEKSSGSFVNPSYESDDRAKDGACGEPVMESGLGGPIREVAEQNVKMRTYLNYESEFLESMWSEMEELELEASHQFDKSILLAKFLDARSGFISALPSLRPINGGYISSHFGRRQDPFTGSIKMHTGIDLAHSARVPVYATADGVVALVSRSPSYGNVVSIYHGYGISTLYAHLHRNDVNTGDRISKGQQIGTLGSTGRSTHSHLHYEVRDRELLRSILSTLFLKISLNSEKRMFSGFI